MKTIIRRLEHENHEITNLVGFFKKPENPDPKTFKPIDGGAVVLNTDFPGGFKPPFFLQNTSASAKVDPSGNDAANKRDARAGEAESTD